MALLVSPGVTVREVDHSFWRASKFEAAIFDIIETVGETSKSWKFYISCMHDEQDETKRRIMNVVPNARVSITNIDYFLVLVDDAAEAAALKIAFPYDRLAF